MARGYNNYSFVVDNSYHPFNMQEMLTPMLMYKDEFEKREAALDELNRNTDTFKYLEQVAKDNPESEAARIYTNYANDLRNYGEDFAQNGLNMGNRRGLLNLKRRYQGEIGRLVSADAAMQEERKLRRTMNAKDSSMLYASDNMSIDDFLDGNTPNLYNISGTELYARGAAAGKAASSRVYSAGDEGSTLNGYYRKWVERNGYSKESMDAFRANASAIPELQQAADDILKERGVTENLTGNNFERARQSVLNGIIDGAIYQEKVNPVRDAEVMSASERDASARGWAASTRAQQQMELSALKSGYKRENGRWVLDEEGLKKRAEVMGIAGYNPDDWEMGPDGKPRRKTRTSTAQTSTGEKIREKKDAALLKLDKSALRNEKGFDVNVGNERQHYDYIAALVHNPKQDKWYSGHLGEDFKGHNGIALWSDVNVVDRLGNYSVTRWRDKADRRVLAGNEVAALANNKDIANSIEDELVKSNLYTERTIQGVMSEYKLPREKAIEQLEKSGYKYISDYQLVAVKNDEGDDDYLIAVRSK